MSVVVVIEETKELEKIIEWAKQQERDHLVTVCACSSLELALASV